MVTKPRLILCVDDDDDDQYLITTIISEIDADLQVVCVYDGVEALSFLQQAQERNDLPCLVILDLNMPRMDGKQTLVHIKEQLALAQMPVVLFTTSSLPLDKAFAEHHSVPFVTKPLIPEELRQTVQHLISLCS